MIETEFLAGARSVLSVPGHRPERFEKAAESGADLLMLDVEDAVGPDLKPQARRNIADWFASGGEGMVRINGFGTPWHDDDVAAFAGEAHIVVLPKVDDAKQVTSLSARLAAGSSVIPLLETARGIINAPAICQSPAAIRAMFGNADLGGELGVGHAAHTGLMSARSQVAIASAAAGMPPPWDGPTAAVYDDDVTRADAEHAAELGFTGKLCLHPQQIPVVHAVFSPSEADIRWARNALAAIEDGNAATMDGQVIAKGPVERARRILSAVRRSP